MNIENTLKTLIEGEGYRYIHLIDGYALNTMLPQLTREASPFVVNYVSLGGGFSINGGVRRERQRVQLLMADIVPFDADATAEADSVSAVNETQKGHVNNIIDAINDSGDFEEVTDYSIQIVPLRFDAVCACLTVEFTLTEAVGSCVW